jgi:hypothetical protein
MMRHHQLYRFNLAFHANCTPTCIFAAAEFDELLKLQAMHVRHCSYLDDQVITTTISLPPSPTKNKRRRHIFTIVNDLHQKVVVVVVLVVLVVVVAALTMVCWKLW